jgi:hypothetical protein
LQLRSIDRVVDAVRTLEGAGVLVHRSFPTPELSLFDPFLLLDEMGPVTYGPNEAIGFPDHPHRGFETVTYVLNGRMQHKDSRGHAGQLGPGDVQWMTAGSGVVHSEMPEDGFAAAGGLMHGFQLWVNLPASHKMMPPRYQEVAAAGIPSAASDGGLVTVRVVAGEALGAKAVIDTVIPIAFLHFTLQPGGAVTQPLPMGANAFAYVLQGRGLFGDEQVAARRGQAVLFSTEGDAARFEAPASASEPLSLLLLAGQPLNEPVARYGPFVMNTRAEIIQAVDDYRSGRMGAITF